MAALMLAALPLPALRIELQVPVAAAVSTLSLWKLATGAWLLRRPRA